MFFLIFHSKVFNVYNKTEIMNNLSEQINSISNELNTCISKCNLLHESLPILKQSNIQFLILSTDLERDTFKE